LPYTLILANELVLKYAPGHFFKPISTNLPIYLAGLSGKIGAGLFSPYLLIIPA
jgi:hypothetical protein